MSKCVVERVPWVAKKSQKPSSPSSDTAQEESPVKIRTEEAHDTKVATLIAAQIKKAAAKVKADKRLKADKKGTSTSKKQQSQSTNKKAKASKPAPVPASKLVVETTPVYLTPKKTNKRPFQSIQEEEDSSDSEDEEVEEDNEEDEEDNEENEEDEEEESSESESDDIHSTTNTANTAWRNKNGDMYYELNTKHRCTVQSYLGQAYIDLREYKLNNNTGAMYPTTKGIKLTINDWNTFLRCIPNLSKALKELPPQSPEIIQSQKAKAEKKWANSQKKTSKKAKYSKD